ncbi:MAG: hypothetical protein KGI25_04365 [Thaumarchaeota archaeon]|nr:hypothetical protein [Nitrososphaerota archaeon]
MSSEFRLKKLRGSGGYVMANVNDDQQRKGNLGGPDLFLAPIGRLDSEKISKYYCNTCEKEYEGSPRIDYESPNEVVAENLVLLEKGQYMCTTCGSVLAEYRNFSKPDEKSEVGLARSETAPQEPYASPSAELQRPIQDAETSGVKTFNSVIGLSVYDAEAKRVGVVKEIGIQSGQSGIILAITKTDGTTAIVKWNEIRKIGEIVLLGGEVSNDFRCSKCGSANTPSSKFCEACGNKLK